MLAFLKLYYKLYTFEYLFMSSKYAKVYIFYIHFKLNFLNWSWWGILSYRHPAKLSLFFSDILITRTNYAPTKEPYSDTLSSWDRVYYIDVTADTNVRWIRGSVKPSLILLTNTTPIDYYVCLLLSLTSTNN